jgi:tRNA(Leu) C34 or U34 (ribose-2'-O)-methylase TrmL
MCAVGKQALGILLRIPCFSQGKKSSLNMCMSVNIFLYSYLEAKL